MKYIPLNPTVDAPGNALAVTQAAVDNGCYIELDWVAGKPVFTSKQRVKEGK